jgi:hypothetical protein
MGDNARGLRRCGAGPGKLPRVCDGNRVLFSGRLTHGV